MEHCSKPEKKYILNALQAALKANILRIFQSFPSQKASFHPYAVINEFHSPSM